MHVRSSQRDAYGNPTTTLYAEGAPHSARRFVVCRRAKDALQVYWHTLSTPVRQR